MANWSKSADWLPLSNALAQVNFWMGDLAQAEQYLAYVKSFKKYNLPGYEKMFSVASKDVATSKAGLKAAQAKLAETKKRDG